MKFTLALAALVGATAVTAAPLEAPAARSPIYLGDGVTLVPREPSLNRRRIQRSGFRKPVPKVGSEDAAIDNGTYVQYSSNWAGAVLIGSGYKSVTGTFTVPTPKTPSGGSSRTEYAASAWVGLDGDTCQTSILQTGASFYVQGGSTSYEAWYEWFPDYAYTFSGFAISPGNSIKVTATASSTSSGSVTVQNLSTGKSVSHSFSGQSAHLCETNAEWIVEDFEEGGSLVPFANFGTVTFTGASVTTTGGSTVGVSGAQILDIQQGSSVLTNCGTSGSSTVTCTYV